MKRVVHFSQVILALVNSSCTARRGAVVGNQKEKLALSFYTVFVDQGLKARIGSQGVPNRIKS